MRTSQMGKFNEFKQWFYTRCWLYGEFLAPTIATEMLGVCAQWYLLGIASTINFFPLIYLQAMEILLQDKFNWYNCSTKANWASVFFWKTSACGSKELGSSFCFYFAASTDTLRVSREGHARIILHPSFSWREISRNLLIPDVVTSWGELRAWKSKESNKTLSLKRTLWYCAWWPVVLFNKQRSLSRVLHSDKTRRAFENTKET